jgi:LCP family protein required for cell wall assembly
VTGRVERSAYPPARAAVRSAGAARPLLSPSQRLLFVLALLTFALASFYSSLALLARVTPALFPGRSLTDFSLIRPLASLNTPLVSITSPGDDSVLRRRIDLLILGLDKRPGYRFEDSTESGYLTDTIMVATIDPVAKTTSVLSFPRDLWIDVANPRARENQRRINVSFGDGVRATGTIRGGVEELKADLKHNFGIEIDHYVILDFEGVAYLVDAIGGVEVNVPPDLAVPRWFYSDDDIHGVWIEIPPGLNRLDGFHAVAFGRHREYDSDLDRVKRQQLVLQAALSKAFQLGILRDPAGLWNAYASSVRTDIPYARFPGYLDLLRATNGRLRTFSLGDPVNGIPTVTSFQTPAGASVLSWNPTNVRYWLNQVFTKPAYSGSNVEIQNGFGADGGARAAALGRYLAYVRGLPTVYHGPDAPEQPRTTITLHHLDRRILAEDIATWLGIPHSQIVVSPSNDTALPDVVITVGRDFRIPGT